MPPPPLNKYVEWFIDFHFIPLLFIRDQMPPPPLNLSWLPARSNVGFAANIFKQIELQFLCLSDSIELIARFFARISICLPFKKNNSCSIISTNFNQFSPFFGWKLKFSTFPKQFLPFLNTENTEAACQMKTSRQYVRLRPGASWSVLERPGTFYGPMLVIL